MPDWNIVTAAVWVLATALISAAATLLAVAINAWRTSRRENRARHYAFRREQLDHFYSPMLALRTLIRSLSEVRTRVHDASAAQWEEDVGRDLGIDQMQQLEELTRPEHQKLIEDDNRRLKDELIPMYDRMIDLFVSKMWLAEPSTREHFPLLVDHVDIFKRFLDSTLPKGVARRLDHREDKLFPLYDDLQHHFDRLRAELDPASFWVPRNSR